MPPRFCRPQLAPAGGSAMLLVGAWLSLVACETPMARPPLAFAPPGWRGLAGSQTIFTSSSVCPNTPALARPSSVVGSLLRGRSDARRILALGMCTEASTPAGVEGSSGMGAGPQRGDADRRRSGKEEPRRRPVSQTDARQVARFIFEGGKQVYSSLFSVGHWLARLAQHQPTTSPPADLGVGVACRSVMRSYRS